MKNNSANIAKMQSDIKLQKSVLNMIKKTDFSKTTHFTGII